eukprot:2013628-Rhodomonas_salina.2
MNIPLNIRDLAAAYAMSVLDIACQARRTITVHHYQTLHSDSQPRTTIPDAGDLEVEGREVVGCTIRDVSTGYRVAGA